MALSQRTKKRLAILCGVSALVSGFVYSVYLVREAQLDDSALTALDTGIADYAEEDYEGALHGIGTYLQRFGEQADADTLYTYADSRLQVPVPNDRHITESIAILDRVLEIDPDHSDATSLLLNLRLRIGQTLEAIRLAERVLGEDPKHSLANKILIVAHQISGDPEASLEAARRYYQQKPDDLEVVSTLVSMMLRSPTERRDLGGETGLLARLGKKHAEDAGFQLMIAEAYRVLEDEQNARTSLEAAIAIAGPNDETATKIAYELMRDPERGFTSAFSYINSVIDSRDSDSTDLLKFWLAQQQFFLAEFDTAIAQAKRITSQSDVYTEAQAILALIAAGRDELDLAAEHLAELEKIDSSRAEMWERVLKATALAQGPRAASVRPLLLQAIEEDPDNPYYSYLLAMAYRDLGEPELAARYLSSVVNSEPAWWSAAVELASLYNAMDNFPASYRLLDQTYRLHPENDPVRIRWAVAATSQLSPGDPVTARETLETINSFKDGVARRLPQSIVSLEVATARCLGAIGKIDQLKQTVMALVEGQEDKNILAECNALNQRYQLGIDLKKQLEKFRDPIQEAIEQADLLVAQDEPERAEQVVDLALKDSSLESDAQDRIRLDFIDRHGLPGGVPLWRRALEKNDDNPAFLHAAARSQMVLSDPELGSEVPEKLKALTGEEGLAWRFAKLRHEALGAKTEAMRASVVEELSALVRSGYTKPEARLLLATLLESMGNTRGSLNQLTLAVDESPYHARANLALIRMALLEQRYAIAKAAMGRVAMLRNLSPALSAEIARVADTLGERDIARELRARDGVGVYLLPEEKLGLLQNALVNGRQDAVDALTEQLLASEVPRILQQAAILLALYNGPDAAGPATAALESLPSAGPAILVRTLASIYELTGDPSEALQILEEAIKQGLVEQDPELRTQYLRVLLYQPQGLSDAIAALRGNDRNSNTKAALACFESASQHDDQRRTILQLLGLEALSSDTPGVYSQLARLISEDSWETSSEDTFGASQPGPTAQLIDRLDSLLEERPELVSLHNLMTRLYIIKEQFAKAITLAQQTRERFPRDAASARLLSQAYAETKQWRLVLGAARTWRQVATPTRQTLETIDLLTATALIEAGDPTAALNTIRGYGSERALALTARSLIRIGRISDAEEILFPLIRTDSPRWRITVIQLALTDLKKVDPAVAGRWLDRVEPIIPVDALGERLLWAQSCFVIGQVADDEGRQNRAYALVSAMSNQPNFPASGWLVIGVYNDSLGQTDEAEQAYRKAVAIDATQLQAANNLANILMKRDKLSEARELAERVVKQTQQQPRPTYLDTLAQVNQADQNLEAASALWSEAIRIDPENAKWYISQAELMVELNRFDEARDLLRRMRQWAPAVKEDDKALLDRVEKLEAQLRD